MLNTDEIDTIIGKIQETKEGRKENKYINNSAEPPNEYIKENENENEQKNNKKIPTIILENGKPKKITYTPKETETSTQTKEGQKQIIKNDKKELIKHIEKLKDIDGGTVAMAGSLAVVDKVLDDEDTADALINGIEKVINFVGRHKTEIILIGVIGIALILYARRTPKPDAMSREDTPIRDQQNHTKPRPTRRLTRKRNKYFPSVRPTPQMLQYNQTF
jgi:hypothetical protein